MSHPFNHLTTHQRKWLFWLSTLGSLLLMGLLNMVGAPLMTDEAPFGIVSYELAGGPLQTNAILESWDQQARLRAAFSLGLDYLFMLAYSTAISIACLWAAGVLRQRKWPLVILGVPLAWGQWLAAFLDALENVALTILLLAPTGSPWPELAKWSAVIKFSLVFLGLVYAFYGLVVYLFTRWAAEV